MRTPLQRRSAVSALAAFLLAGPAAGQNRPALQGLGRLVELTVSSPSLRGNKLGDPSDQPVTVYLPPSYDLDQMRRYPTLYLLHGFNGSGKVWLKGGYQGMSLQPVMDSLIRHAGAHEMIVVVPTGDNSYHGSFYVNSATTGRWEDYIVRDLVRYVDSAFRTLSRAESRGIAGHSMGGYGAVVLGARHPDVYGALYGLSPCCLEMVADLTAMNPAWKHALAIRSKTELKRDPDTYDDFFSAVFLALGAVWSPDPVHGPLFLSLPYRMVAGKLVANPLALKAWKSKTALPLSAANLDSLRHLRGIAIDFGEKEDFAHIRLGTAHLSQALAAAGIPHTFEVYPKGDHGSHIRERFEQKVIPFFSRMLVADGQRPE